MSLATRCASCGTVFRVVQDQLRVSSGWVRCGRCGEVFDAIESLVDMAVKPAATESASIDPSRSHARADVTVGAQAATSPFGGFEEERDSEGAGPWSSSDAPEAASSPVSTPPATVAAETPAGRAASSEAPAHQVASLSGSPPTPMTDATEGAESKNAAFAPTEVPASMFPPTGFVDYAADGGIDSPSAIDEGIERGDSAAEAALDPQPTQATVTPAFVARAERAARWRRPRVRAALGVAVFGAALGLAWQSLSSHHDWFASRWPALKPIAASVCVVSACDIEPPLQIEGLAVDSSTLTKTPISGQYGLAVTLRNRSAMDVRIPALDLTLTDAMGQVTVRRVLSPEELGVQHNAVPGRGELIIAARLRVDAAPVVGYTIGLFYP